MSNRLKFGLVLPTGAVGDLPPDISPDKQFDLMISIVKEAEALGFDSIWLYDHLVAAPIPTPDSCFESWTMLAALAASTKKIKIGTMVSCASFRHPAVLAKMAATIDQISDGRLILGVGAGWYGAEFDMMGIPFEKNSVRIGKLDETVQVVKKMWREEESSFQGKYYSLNKARCEPKPVQQPHPRILIGGGGEQLTLKVVAREADMCSLALWLDVEKIRRKLEILVGYCRTYGRDPHSIEKTVNREVIVAGGHDEAIRKAESVKPKPVAMESFLRPRIVGSPSECAEQLKKYVDVGVTYFMCYLYGAPSIEAARLFAKKTLPQIKNGLS
ncbi:MAG: TIGR03560 family F420-dependent LLM class oxidoreductase [Thaumarchaeota archaeon]|nr:TIGR03560 family F420-dependent LLM class oxidoreductase [Nitrososphaerota archaeon]